MDVKRPSKNVGKAFIHLRKRLLLAKSGFGVSATMQCFVIVAHFLVCCLNYDHPFHCNALPKKTQSNFSDAL